MTAPKTITAFIESSNIPAKLIRAVIAQTGGWESFKENAPDVANHGAAGGFGGFIYYTDTVRFARKNKALIMELLKAQAHDCGYESAYTMIAGFNGLKDDALTPDRVAELICRNFKEDEEGETTQIYNILAWYALEEVSRAYIDQLEDC